MDLPGIYSLSPYTLEEVVARNYLIGEKPDVILNIVDGTNIERNLYLTTQLLELGIPMIVAINMMDIVQKNGDKIDVQKLSRELGCEVVEISALKGTGIRKAAEKAVGLGQKGKRHLPVHKFSDDAENIIHTVEMMLNGIVPEEQTRFFAIKLLERDDKIQSQMKKDLDVSKEIERMEELFDDDTESIITNERYMYISSMIQDCVTKNKRNKMTTSDKIDRFVTNRWLALPIFAVVMFLVYYISVSTVGTWVTDWTNDVLFGEIIPPAVERFLVGIGCAGWLQGLILDGIVAGVGAVLGFVPQMLVLFLFLAFLEACGYMARVAFIMDRIFRKFGLSGKSFIPMLIGSGCSVPGIMASRTIENDRDRKMTIMTTTFIPCGAKLPIIALIAGALFGGAWWVAPSAYFVGIAAVVWSGIILKKTKMFAGEPAPFVMELPAYHMPTVGNVARSMWERGSSFIKNPCGAKLPIIALIAGALFDGAWWVAPSAYFVGIAAIVCSGIILKKTKMFAGDPAPFVMELPAYHWPTVGNVLRSMWERGWSFIKKAGTIILLSTIVLWFLMNFGWADGSFGMLEAEQLNDSILARIGSVVAPIFAPLGWGNWKMAVAAVTGLIAKENVVGTFGVLFGFAEVNADNGIEIWGQLAGSMTAVAAYSFLVFNLLCAPCFAAMGAIKREMNNAKWFWFAIGYQTGLAYIVSLCIYQIGTWISTKVFGIGTAVAVVLMIGFMYLLLRPYIFGIGTAVAVVLMIGFMYLLLRPYKESKTLQVSMKNTVGAR